MRLGVPRKNSARGPPELGQGDAGRRAALQASKSGPSASRRSPSGSPRPAGAARPARDCLDDRVDPEPDISPPKTPDRSLRAAEQDGHPPPPAARRPRAGSRARRPLVAARHHDRLPHRWRLTNSLSSWRREIHEPTTRREAILDRVVKLIVFSDAEGANMRLRLLVAVVASTFLMALPATVLATKYSPVTWFLNYYPPALPVTELCGQSGIVNPVQNYNQALTKVWDGGSCGASRVVCAGCLGSKVRGYRDGAYCGTTTIYWSNVATAGWQLWSTLCSNPSGTQFFHTIGTSCVIQAGGGVVCGEVTSPGEFH
jgi:hypothetical protein